MSNDQFDPSQPAVDLRQELSRKKTDLESSARFLTFEPGLYAIDFRAAMGSMSNVGLPLPCARLEAVTNPSSPGRAFVTMSPEGGWLSRGTSAAHVLVVGGRAGAVLTIYRPTDGSPMPEVLFRSVLPSAAPRPAPPPVVTAAPVAAPGATGMTLAHVEGRGDLSSPSEEWVGDTAGLRSIEGFALTLPPGMEGSDVEYQGIMGEDWRTPWFEAGGFCGSRGLQLPLLGFCLRLVGEAADKYDCAVYGQFARVGEVGPMGSGEDCSAENMPLTAMRVEITPKQAAEPVLSEEPAKKRWRRSPKA